jgi:hypothetical protein
MNIFLKNFIFLLLTSMHLFSSSDISKKSNESNFFCQIERQSNQESSEKEDEENLYNLNYIKEQSSIRKVEDWFDQEKIPEEERRKKNLRRCYQEEFRKKEISKMLRAEKSHRKISCRFQPFCCFDSSSQVVVANSNAKKINSIILSDM